jgi:thiosulfate/3-mercaptopyruvate sulfurtransferase
MQTFQTLITAAQLHDMLGDPSLVLLDVRHDLADHALGARKYAEGHIPGAIFVGVESQLSGERNGRNGRHPLPAPEAFAETLSRLGVDESKQVVAYDQAQSTYAARVWWMLRWVGHRTVAVLDGGADAWIRAGYTMTTDAAAQPKRSKFEANVSDSPVSVETLVCKLGEIDYSVVDARSADRFGGENETIDPVAGHIPSAHNRPYAQNLNKDGTFKAAVTLRNEWETELGARTPRQVVHSCGSGVTACNNALAMEIAGLPGSRLYPGSWSEWSADPARPVAK